MGTLAGMYNFDKFYIFRAFYLNTQVYSNVVATQNPGSVLD